MAAVNLNTQRMVLSIELGDVIENGLVTRISRAFKNAQQYRPNYYKTDLNKFFTMLYNDYVMEGMLKHIEDLNPRTKKFLQYINEAAVPFLFKHEKTQPILEAMRLVLTEKQCLQFIKVHSLKPVMECLADMDLRHPGKVDDFLKSFDDLGLSRVSLDSEKKS